MLFKNEKKSKKKKIYILLTKFPDTGSRLLSAFTGSYFTHASIGLEEDMNTFYSFVYKGFIVEKINRYVKPGKEPMPCELYEIEVCEKKYKRVKKLINNFVESKKLFSYAKIGLAMCLFSIPYHQNKAYFCSQFVSEILGKCNILNIKKNSLLCLPKHLRNVPNTTLGYKGNLKGFLEYFGISPLPA